MKQWLCVLGMVGIVAAASAFDTKNLVLYVAFEEGQGGNVGDTSATKATGKINGNVKWTKDGKVGGAAEFAADGFVEFPENAALDITKTATCVGWIYPTEAPGDSNLWGRRNAANVGGYTMQWTANKVETWYHIGGWKGTRGFQAEAPKLSAWHFVAGVYDGKDVLQYVNGKLDAKVAAGGDFGKIPEVFRIGKAQTGLVSMPGKMDEVAVYNRALTPDELNDIMANGVAPLSVRANGKLPVVWGLLKK